MVVTGRHQFLSQLHALLQPRFYLEVGVQYGDSLRLANCPAYGIDPIPMVGNLSEGAKVFSCTSDFFFENHIVPAHIDLAFIDGMHRYEYALRDFRNIEPLCSVNGVVVFDDVLPYTQEMTSRMEIPGDWTGDVWKCFYILKKWRPELEMALVDTFPTGTLVVWNLDLSKINNLHTFTGGHPVPQEILDRTIAVPSDVVLQRLREWLDR